MRSEHNLLPYQLYYDGMMNEEHLRYIDNLPHYALPEDFLPDDMYGLDEEASTSCEDYTGDIALSHHLYH